MRNGRGPARLIAIVVAVAILSYAGSTTSTQSPRAPRRIISLIPAVTEMLFAIGAGSRVIGVSSFDHYPPEVETRQRVGALLDPDLERIIALRPDLVIVYGTQTDLRGQLERASVPTFVYSHKGLDDITTTLEAIGSAVGLADDAAAAARQIQGRIAFLKTRVAGRPKVRTLVVFGREPFALRGIYASGGRGFIHDMVVAAGGMNVFGDVARESIQATTELVLARRPDVILELRANPLGADDLKRERSVWNTLASVPAVRTGRVFIIADERTVIPGPRVADGIELIAHALHPEAFRR